MFKNILFTAIYLQIKIVVIYYCLYSAIVYNFLMGLMLDPKLPDFFKTNDRLILLLLSIISAYSFNKTMKSSPIRTDTVKEKPLNIG